MIGVVAKTEDHAVVEELFELFKTPWEYYERGRSYEVILAPAADDPGEEVPLRILFGAEPVGEEEKRLVAMRRKNAELRFDRGSLPLCGSCLVFHAEEGDLKISGGHGCVSLRRCSGKSTAVRLGYDLLKEIRQLLVEGQPERAARVPTLDQHVALLRGLIVRAGVPMVEIPPVPAGHPFAVCLTHDVDHPVLRNHRFDKTALGFLWRATAGSVSKALRGRMTVRQVLRNWLAALRFPLVHLGLVPDCWSRFDRYLEIERGLASTFFVIPRRGEAGKNVQSAHPERRAASYSLEDVRPQLDRILDEGGEVALHGIDAWTDLEQGREERNRIAQVTGRAEMGVRMHWLCFDADSPRILDEGGFTYDSTAGYNGTVGYWAGTLQVFRPPGTTRLCELPLHIMDTALFYPAHLNLSRAEAGKAVRGIIADAVRLGGVLTLNWHDRSIAPERQWDGFYLDLLEELKQLDPWFATASEAVAWFRVRRSAVFEEIRREGRVVGVKVTAGKGEASDLPGLRLRVTRRGDSEGRQPESAPTPVSSIEEQFRQEIEIELAA